MHNRQILWLGFLATLGAIATTTSVAAQDASVTNQSDTSGVQITSPSTVIIDNLNGNGIPNVTVYDPNTGIISGGSIDNPVQSGSTNGSGTATGSSTGTGSTSGSGTATGSSTGTGSTSGSGGGLGSTTSGESNSTNGTGSSETTNALGGSDSGEGSSVAIEKSDCTSVACLEAQDRPQKITLNDAAELLENNLDDSLDTLVAAEEGGSQADTIGTEPSDGEPRRIARNNVRRNTTDDDARRIVRNSSRCVSGCANPQRPTFKTRQVEATEIAEAREVVERQLEASQKFIEQVNLIDPEKNIW